MISYNVFEEKSILAMRSIGLPEGYIREIVENGFLYADYYTQ